MHRFFIVLVAVSMAAGCQPNRATQDVGSDDQSVPHIAVIPKGTTHVFWQSVRRGAEAAADEFGGRITFRGPARESDRDEQINIVQGFLNAQVDGIVLAPLDADALVRPVEEAGRGGVPVVVFDSGLNAPEGTFVSYVATDNFRGGQMAGHELAKNMDETGNVVLFRYNKGSESTYQREEGFLEAISTYPGISVLSSDQYAGTTTETAVDKAQAVMNRFGDQIDGVFAVCEPNAEGVLRALKDRGAAGKVKFVAFDSSDSLRDALATGQVNAIILQDPFQMGYLAVKAMLAHLRGESVEPVIDTGIAIATAENRDDEAIANLLNPPK